nr:hypothetical protein [Pelobacter seleniigenes]
MTGFHLGTVGIGDVALHFLAAMSQARFVLFEKTVNLVTGFEQGIDLLLLFLTDLVIVRKRPTKPHLLKIS